MKGQFTPNTHTERLIEFAEYATWYRFINILEEISAHPEQTSNVSEESLSYIT